MNRYQELLQFDTKLAVLGINENSLKLALQTAEHFPVMVMDSISLNPQTLDTFLSRKGLYLTDLKDKSLELGQSSADLRSAGIYYLNGITSKVMDWASIKTTAALIGKSLNVGDWVVFGAHIDPDMAEVVLVDILESTSGLQLGAGLEIAFDPNCLAQVNFDNMSNEMKLSHNLIISEVEKIFNTKVGGEFGSNQIQYRDSKIEINQIKAKIVELWVPMLNEMTPGTFREFVELSIKKSFLDAYSHLKLSTESKVNWRRFFEIATGSGLEHSLDYWQEFKTMGKAV